MGFKHIYFDEKVCNGCNTCVDVCMCDAFVANSEKGKPPILKYPEECWLCGACVTDCPKKDERAIRIVTPFQLRGSFLKR
jgi:NAD-dependent dihydropyrimidine dehydrogenase PreA subunit